MTTIERFQAIKAECQRLLALAEKRTHGRWTLSAGCIKAGAATVANPPRMTDVLPPGGIGDAEFIAACAGPSEAGWKATIAAIDDILPYLQEDDAADGAVTPGHRWLLIRRSEPIISAWEGIV